MKSTGIVRKVDELGRVVIPMELRRTLGIAEKTPLEIFVDGEQIIIQKYQVDMACAVTGEVSEQNISLLDGKLVLSEDGAKYLINSLQNAISKGEIK